MVGNTRGDATHHEGEVLVVDDLECEVIEVLAHESPMPGAPRGAPRWELGYRLRVV